MSYDSTKSWKYIKVWFWSEEDFFKQEIVLEPLWSWSLIIEFLREVKLSIYTIFSYLLLLHCFYSNVCGCSTWKFEHDGISVTSIQIMKSTSSFTTLIMNIRKYDKMHVCNTYICIYNCVLFRKNLVQIFSIMKKSLNVDIYLPLMS